MFWRKLHVLEQLQGLDVTDKDVNNESLPFANASNACSICCCVHKYLLRVDLVTVAFRCPLMVCSCCGMRKNHFFAMIIHRLLRHSSVVSPPETYRNLSTKVRIYVDLLVHFRTNFG